MQPTSPRFGSFTVRTACPRCGQPVALNAPSLEAHCPACSGDFRVPEAAFTTLVGAFDDAYDSFAGGARATDQAIVEGMTLQVTRRAGPPTCEKCEAPLVFPSPDPTGAPRPFHCASCGDAAVVLAAPPWLKRAVPTVSFVVASDAAAAPGPRGAVPAAVGAGAQPVMMQCPQCSAPLRATVADERVVRCGHCNVEVYLPDDLWRRLHPVKIVASWCVRFDGPSRAALAREAGARAAAEQAEARRVAIVAGEAAQVEREGHLRAEVDRLREQAWLVTWAFIAVITAANLWTWITPSFLGVPVAGSVAIAGLVASVGTLAFALAFGARPIQRATRYGGAAMMFVAWFFAIFGLVMPFVGSVMCLGVAAKRFQGTLGGVTIETNGSSEYFPPIQLTQREAWPLAVAYLGLGLLWPLLIGGCVRLVGHA